MKTKYIIIGFAALALMVSCSKTRTEAQPDPVPDPDGEAWITDESLPVPVEFTAPTVESKAMIEDITEIKSAGVFGLNKEGSWGTEENDDVLIYNKEAQSSQVESTWKLSFNPAVYYPMHNENNYTFYGYHPYTETVEYVGTRRYEATFEIGNVDIVWAKAEAVPFEYNGAQYDGFNGRYIRAVENGYGTGTEKVSTPHFQFEHMLTALVFNVVSADGTSLGNVRVKGIEVDAYTQGTLLIADLYDTEWEGKVNPVSGSAGAVKVMDDNGTDEFNILPDGTTKPVGNVILIPAESYDMRLLLTTQPNLNGEPTPVEAVISREGGFEAGKRYNLTVKVYSPTEVEISVDVTPWDDVDDTPEIEIG